ncbi:hypothetical protein ACET3X_008372 [Alternaria dauci]|uniref:Uncharacterized protein n=1 Tax=Alternaria dauci TaxID=48095 RepID=A0ABR3UAP3_9PLEO
MSSSPQRHTPSKGRVIEGGMASNYGSPLRSGRNVRFHTRDQLSVLPSVVEGTSHGSASTDSFSTSGGSLSQLGSNNAADHSMTASRGQVNNQMLQAKQQLPTTPQRARRMTDIPEYLAVQEMAFRQGQYVSGDSPDRVPPSPFAKHFDHVWAQYFKMGVAHGGVPATPLIASSPPGDNFAWSILINPATQDLEHPNGSLDMEWARKMCIMSLNCMKELIHAVRERHNDWRKIVCDIPLPVQQAIVAFPDLCEYYAALQHEAHQAFGNGL